MRRSFFDLKIEMRDQRATLRQFSDSRDGARLLRRSFGPRAAISAAFNASMSSGSEARSASTDHMESQNRPFEAPLFVILSRFSSIRRPSGAPSLAACANRCRTADRRAGPSRSSPFHRPTMATQDRPRSNRFENRHKPWPSLQRRT